MRRGQKILIGIFLSGVLLGGIGTGIAVGEFSSLGYGGRKLIGEENLVTKELDFEIPTDGRHVILAYHGYRYGWEGGLVEDSSVPVGVVRYEVTYNERQLEPHLSFFEYEEETENLREAEQEEESEEIGQMPEETPNIEETTVSQEDEEEPEEPVYAGELYLEFAYKGNDFELFMENKDRILEELKQKKLSSYEMVSLTEITIRVNPETKKYIKDMFFK